MHAVTPHESKMLLERYQAILIDARDAPEYAQSHIPYAISLPYSDKSQWLDWLCLQSPQVWIVYCSKGSRSTKMTELLLEKFTFHPERRVYVMQGGLHNWISEGFEVLTPGGEQKEKDCIRRKIDKKLLVRVSLACILLASGYYIGINQNIYSIGVLAVLALGYCVICRRCGRNFFG